MHALELVDLHVAPAETKPRASKYIQYSLCLCIMLPDHNKIAEMLRHSCSYIITHREPMLQLSTRIGWKAIIEATLIQIMTILRKVFVNDKQFINKRIASIMAYGYFTSV